MYSNLFLTHNGNQELQHSLDRAVGPGSCFYKKHFSKCVCGSGYLRLIAKRVAWLNMLGDISL